MTSDARQPADTDLRMTAGDFAHWLAGLMAGPDEVRTRLARPETITEARELVNGELRPSLVAFFPGGGFVVTIATVGPPESEGA